MRFFCERLPNVGEPTVLPDEVRKHAIVLRLKPGDELELFSEGKACRAQILRLDEKLVVNVCHTSQHALLDPAPVTLVQALPKAKKLDTIIRMAVEIGVESIQLVTSERTIPRWSPDRTEDKMARLRRVAQEAARQSNQQRVAKICAPMPLIDAARSAPETATRIVFWEASTAHLPRPLARRPTWVAIGPEGGWSQREAHTLLECGWVDASLPTGILRVQTAAPVALAIVRDRLADAGAD